MDSKAHSTDRNAIGQAVEVRAAANTILVAGDGSEFGELVS
jgi:hypothetical protein